MSNALFDLKNFLKNLTTHPGVYRMLDTQGEVIYVGKARHLKRRVSSYFNKNHTDRKTQRMVSQVASIEITVTMSESEALLLEYTLIKSHQPKYNVIFRDDKSYPYIYVGTDEAFPHVKAYRGAKNAKGRYFGPYPSMASVRDTLYTLQKLFPVRQCTNSFFRNRTRPCLQYQIKRCSAPCVGYISEKEYNQDVEDLILFLQGKEDTVTKGLTDKMSKASDELDFEKAARYRDQLVVLRKLQSQQVIHSDKANNVDVLGIVEHQGEFAVTQLFVRQGRVLGNKTLFPKISLSESKESVMTAFICQHYLNAKQTLVELDEIITPMQLEVSTLLNDEVKCTHITRGEKRKWLQLATLNAEQALESHKTSAKNHYDKLVALQEAFDLPEAPKRIECFDISHSLGEQTVASCVVCTEKGMENKYYRKFNIKDITPGDDYAAMRQVLMRRYKRVESGEMICPDVVLIDGGKGQLKQALEVFQELQIKAVSLIGIAKGPERQSGQEDLFLNESKTPVHLAPAHPGFLLLQQIRDEAHRFAIAGHRAKRAKKRQQSLLEDIPGVGDKRRIALLKYFGGIQGLKKASADEISKTPGINSALAQKIYLFFNQA